MDLNEAVITSASLCAGTNTATRRRSPPIGTNAPIDLNEKITSTKSTIAGTRRSAAVKLVTNTKKPVTL
jgi:hypothetical protein